MQCSDWQKFDVDWSITNLTKNQQSTTSVHWHVGLKGLKIDVSKFWTRKRTKLKFMALNCFGQMQDPADISVPPMMWYDDIIAH